ncbi:MAG TPA: hypothetical protein VFR97_03780, partial [Capillimicrobium sp.]|nr:hypothetical protein [Capillimicrobium sp.]
DAARAIADVVEGPPRRGRVNVAGPEVQDARQLARAWRQARRRRAAILRLPLPGGVGRALRSGALTTDAPDVRGTTTFSAWLRTATS